MINKITIIILLSFVLVNAASQNLTHRASRTMDYRFEDCSSLQVQGEKATIRITGSAQNTVELKIVLVAKHANKETALKDLKNIRFVSQKEGSKLYLRNYYESVSHKIESNLSVIYELIVPEKMVIQLQNLYGAVVLNHLKGAKTIDVSFGQLDMQNIEGNTNLLLKYSNVNIQEITGQLSGSLSKSDVDLNGCRASTAINMNYGTCKAIVTDECDLMHITGNRTEIILQVPSTDYNMDVKNSYSSVQVFNKTVQQPYHLTTKTSIRKLIISTTYCPIKINLK